MAEEKPVNDEDYEVEQEVAEDEGLDAAESIYEGATQSGPFGDEEPAAEEEEPVAETQQPATEGTAARDRPIAAREYYSISEVCELVGLKPHVLRYWETQFPVLNPSKNRSGNRA